MGGFEAGAGRTTGGEVGIQLAGEQGALAIGDNARPGDDGRNRGCEAGSRRQRIADVEDGEVWPVVGPDDGFDDIEQVNGERLAVQGEPDTAECGMRGQVQYRRP